MIGKQVLTYAVILLYIISYHMLYYDIRQNADEIKNITKYSD